MTARSKGPSSSRRKHPTRPKPVADVLPESLRQELRITLRKIKQVSRAVVDDIDLRFGISARHGVSKRRLINYLRKVHEDCVKNAGSDSQDDGESTRVSANDESTRESVVDGWPDQVAAHRRRQASIASVLDATLGRLANCHPDLWGHRAYLMLIGLVYDRLANAESDLSTEDLVKLAKVFAECRRAERGNSPSNQQERNGATESTNGRTLPGNFGEIIRQVYGTNFHPPSSSTGHDADGTPTDDHGSLPDAVVGAT